MLYYRVKPEYDNKTRYVWRRGYGVPDSIIIARELYTPREYARLAMCPAWFEPVQISKRRVYTSFGARFESGVQK